MNMNNIEIHTLICKKDIILAINNFKSLCKFEEFSSIPIFLHDDGSLNLTDKEILSSSIANSTIIDRKIADVEIANHLSKHPMCNKFRLIDSHIHLWHKIKLFDYFFFSKTKKVLGMDTDLLFMRKPEEVLKFLREDVPFYFPDIQSAYCFNDPKTEITTIDKVNTGLIYIPSEKFYNLDSIEHALTNLLRGDINYFPSWIEQSAFAHMFHENGKYKVLSPSKYKIPYFQQVDIETIECLHFVSYPAVRELYETYTKYLSLHTGKETYNKNFIVEFDGKRIPLQLTLRKDENAYVFSYVWDIASTNQPALDHHFRLEIPNVDSVVYKFQSNRTGFFFMSPTTQSITVFHTYDWYGKTDWKILDIIQT